MVGSVSQASGVFLSFGCPQSRPSSHLLCGLTFRKRAHTLQLTQTQRCSGARVGPVTCDPSLPEDKLAEEFWGPGRSCGGNSYLGKASMPVSAARTEYSLFQG